ncbi:hypothetical protein [Pseudomonas baetica]|uniref:hypothetical protein n=1 Tax=Pseudomonas baetica TaxID=674054 RepID=UPI002404CC56|nr:hypothetical protein [Pseudomonas baetica]MDF9778750.1 hypothetical protein [Pseudomonas baetica]
MARLTKRLISGRDGIDAYFPPKVTGGDQWLYAMSPCLPALSRRMRSRGESPDGGEYPPIPGAIVRGVWVKKSGHFLIVSIFPGLLFGGFLPSGMAESEHVDEEILTSVR